MATLQFFKVTELPSAPMPNAIYYLKVGSTITEYVADQNGAISTPVTGPGGPANTLAIGTVTTGLVPEATITGLAPNQTLNLVIPEGQPGPPGTGATGTAVINFGPPPGVDMASVAVTGQVSISALNVVQGWVQPIATVDHSSDEHLVEEIEAMAGAIVPGTGFTITARTRNRPLTGQWTVAWTWR